MKKVALLLGLLAMLSFIGCSSIQNPVSNDGNNQIIQKVTPSDGDPIDGNDGPPAPGDPGGMGDGYG